MVKSFRYTQKRIFDSVHGFIPFDDIERKLIDSIPFQRLHYIHQSGVAYLVYPGATHCRFEHSLGVMELATRMYKQLCQRVRPDLYDLVPRVGSVEYLYWKKILRIAALCHDLGQFPFSYVLGEAVSSDVNYEYWTLKILQSHFLQEVWELLHQAPFDETVVARKPIEDVIKVCLGEKRLKEVWPNHILSFSVWEHMLYQIISNDFLGADPIDYLLRDAKHTGVGYGLFDYLQLIDSLRFLPSKEKGIELGIDESGLESTEALFLARHFMHERVYLHPSVQAYGFHLRNALRAMDFFDTVDEGGVEKFVVTHEAHILCHLTEEAKKLGHSDAKKIILREPHHRAIPIPESIPTEELEKIQKKLKLTKEQMTWEIKNPELTLHDLSFPVASRFFMIESAKNLSKIFSVFSFKPVCLVYLDPEVEQLFQEEIKI